MLISLAVGVAVGVVIGLSLGWSGAKYPEETSFTLSFLTAIGTVGAALGAVYASWVALKTYKDDKAARISESVDNAYLYFDSKKECLREVVEMLEVFLDAPPVIKSHRDWSDLASKIKNHRDDLQQLDLKKAAIISLNLRACFERIEDELTKVISIGNTRRIKSGSPLGSVEEVVSGLSQVNILIAGILNGVESYILGRGDGDFYFFTALDKTK